uniref:LysM domain-containing protein n=1 Tax=Hanusia phi TaxID=3032 RepID=A0A7S0DXW7_9CRYP|mmetsp:Transcript_12659/g.29119  ORF Transcript_12659/g.29119 Transcript_12659/m.29119 type:complete len:1310 (+) Transcript_12659:173-4102(+)
MAKLMEVFLVPLFICSYFIPSSASRIEIIQQPVGNVLKGRALSQQPHVVVVLSSSSELSVGQPQQSYTDLVLSEGETLDVNNNNIMTVSISKNPVGAAFSTGSNSFTVRLLNGAYNFTDLLILQGGTGFTLKFQTQDSYGNLISVESDLFDCGGQDAQMHIVQQPTLNVFGSPQPWIPPILQVQDATGAHLPLAEPEISVSIFSGPTGANFSGDSSLSVSASKGQAIFDKLWVTKAATSLDPRITSYLEPIVNVFYVLKFSAPGYADVYSSEFEVLPVLTVEREPVSDHVHVVTSGCSGPVAGCFINFTNYLGMYTDLNGTASSPWKLQSARLSVSVACTDLDGTGEMVSYVTVGSRMLAKGVEYSPGPWAGCAFAGCRSQCQTNTRLVVSELDVLSDLGTIDPFTQLFKSDGRKLSVRLGLTDAVNVCECDGSLLVANATLRLTYSISQYEQDLPLRQQPVISLRNGDGTLYGLMPLIVSVNLSYSPSGALLQGARTLTTANSLATFTDLKVTEAGPDNQLRFYIVGTKNSSRVEVVDASPFNIGTGMLPVLSLDCPTCLQPVVSPTEYEVFSQQPVLNLLKFSGGVWVKALSDLPVQVAMGEGRDVAQIAMTSTRVVRAVQGVVRYTNLAVYNGGCLHQFSSLVFVCNDNFVVSQSFNLTDDNLSPTFASPYPANGSSFGAVMWSSTLLFHVNITDRNIYRVANNTYSDKLNVYVWGNKTWINGFCSSPCLDAKNASCVQLLPDNLDVNSVNLDANSSVVNPSVVWKNVSRIPQYSLKGTTYCKIKPVNSIAWWISLPVKFSPLCINSALNFPGDGGKSTVCLQGVDNFNPLDSTSKTISTLGEERCVEIKTLSPVAPYFVQPTAFNISQAQISGTYLDRENAPPPASAESFPSLTIGVGCKLELPVEVRNDDKTFPGSCRAPLGLSPSAPDTASFSYGLRAKIHRVYQTSLYEQREASFGVLPGPVLDSHSSSNPYTTALRWQPVRGQEGFVYSICLSIQVNLSSTDVNDACLQEFYTAPFLGHPSQYCVTVDVARCRYCVQEGDSMETMARDWGTSILQLWGGNQLFSPSYLESQQSILVGPIYTVGPDETLPEIALKFGRSALDVLDWNPDIPMDPSIINGQLPLLSSQGLYTLGTAPWYNQNGTILTNSQEVCVLPDVCTDVKLPHLVDQYLEAFSCSLCDAGSLYCTAPLCIDGSGTGPWTPATCTKWVGSRCQRCSECQQEVLDAYGNVLIEGTWNSGGCNGTRTGGQCSDCTVDSVCSPCSRCRIDEIEKFPCTLTSDRVCEPISQPASISLGRPLPPPV